MVAVAVRLGDEYPDPVPAAGEFTGNGCHVLFDTPSVRGVVRDHERDAQRAGWGSVWHGSGTFTSLVSFSVSRYLRRDGRTVRNVAYYVPATLYRHPGIRERVRMTVAAWHRAGVTGHVITGQSSPDKPVGDVSLLQHWRDDAAAAKRLRAGLSAGTYSHVHARLFLPTRGWIRLSQRTGALSLEIHAGLRRAESARDRVRVVAGWRSARRLVRNASAAAFVTEELAGLPEYESVATAIVLGNGIRLGEPMKAPNNERPIVGMAVGSDSAWHGLDRLATLAAAMPHVNFRVAHPATVKLRHRSSSITFVPTDNRDDFLGELSSWDVAVGSLALERAGLAEAAPLKVRDYVDGSIPVLLNYRDTNLHNSPDPGLYRLPSAQQQWDLDAVNCWIVACRGRRLEETTRRLVDIDAIERRRLAMFP